MIPKHQEDFESINAPSRDHWKYRMEGSSIEKPGYELNISSQERSSAQSLQFSKCKGGTQLEVQVQIHRVLTKTTPSPALPSARNNIKPGHAVTASRATSNRALQQLAERIVVLEDQGVLNKRGGKMEVQAEIHWLPSKNSPLSQSIRKPHNRSANSVRLTCNNRDLLKLAEQIEILDDQGAVKPLIRKEKGGFLSAVKKLYNRIADVCKNDMRTKAQGHVRTRKIHL